MNFFPRGRLLLAGTSLLCLLCLLPWVKAGAPARPPSSKPDAIEKQFGLKPGPGRNLVLANCIPCHSTAIVAANHLSRKRWEELILEMQTKNGMRPIDADTQKQILDYLEAAQRPEDVGLQAGKQTPWALPLYQANPIWP